MESQIDSLRQRLLDRQESTESVTGVPLTSTRIYQVSKPVVNHLNLVFVLAICITIVVCNYLKCSNHSPIKAIVRIKSYILI